ELAQMPPFAALSKLESLQGGNEGFSPFPRYVYARGPWDGRALTIVFKIIEPVHEPFWFAT
ncbi:MAG: hypothetical protein L0Y58_03150, partial [Verrucomicrobia subdivision 3 bacterium]|nr:hypothetical protein [Limisphaerales bacterium]